MVNERVTGLLPAEQAGPRSFTCYENRNEILRLRGIEKFSSLVAQQPPMQGVSPAVRAWAAKRTKVGAPLHAG